MRISFPFRFRQRIPSIFRHFLTQSSAVAATAKRFKSIVNSPVRRMQQNPLKGPTYRVGAEIYRRNCPLEMVTTATPAVATKLSGEDEDVDDEISVASPSRSASRSSAAEESSSVYVSLARTSSVVLNAETARELGELDDPDKERKPKIASRKTVEVIADNGELYTEKHGRVQLAGSVKYDEKQRLYYDSLKVPTALVGMLRGRDGHKQKKLEDTFRCKVNFPKKHSAGGETEIKFSSTESAHHVVGCRETLEKAVLDARKQAMPTHFISVPIFDAKLREQYSELVKRICENGEIVEEARNPNIFMAPAKLHLTLCVLRLFTEQEIQNVRHFIDELFRSEKIKKILHESEGRIRLEFPALEHFGGRSKEKVSVLFAKAQSERLQRLANAIDDALFEAGLAEKRKSRDVVLHMTVLNTKYLWERRQSFINAVPILERFGELNFEPIDVEELHLCEMKGSSNPEDMNGYKSVHSIKFSCAT